MICKKCKAELPDNSLYCCYCGKKQATVRKSRTHKRAAGTGTISRNPKCKKNSYIVRAPATSHETGRIYVGSYPDMASAQAALEDYIRNGRPALYNATLEDVYKLWSDIHYKRVSESGVKLYSSMWKRFKNIERMKMIELRTTHFQEIVNACTSKSSAEIVKALSTILSPAYRLVPVCVPTSCKRSSVTRTTPSPQTCISIRISAPSEMP